MDILLSRAIVMKPTSKVLEDLKPALTENADKVLSALLESGKRSDVTFVVQDKEFKAHKAVLVAHSAVFEALFDHDRVVEHHCRITVEYMSADAFEQLLNYLYGRSVTRMEDHAEELLVVANKVCNNWILTLVLESRTLTRSLYLTPGPA